MPPSGCVTMTEPQTLRPSRPPASWQDAVFDVGEGEMLWPGGRSSGAGRGAPVLISLFLRL